MTRPILEARRLGPASNEPPRKLVILLHGYGSNGTDMIALAPQWQFAPDLMFLAPNAPERCSGSPGGYQWWGLTDLSRSALGAGARRAAPALDAFIDAQLAEHALEEKDVLLVGFSQGTMMALHVGLRRERSFAGIIGYSGMLADPAGLQHAIRSRPPIMLIHGAADEVVPVAALHEAKHELHRIGVEVESHISATLGHAVDAEGIALGLRFAKKVLQK